MTGHEQDQAPDTVDYSAVLGPAFPDELERLRLVGGKEEFERPALRDLPVQVAGGAEAHLGRDAAGRRPRVRQLGEYMAQARRGGDDRRLAGRRYRIRENEHGRDGEAGDRGGVTLRFRHHR